MPIVPAAVRQSWQFLPRMRRIWFGRNQFTPSRLKLWNQKRSVDPPPIGRVRLRATVFTNRNQPEQLDRIVGAKFHAVFFGVPCALCNRIVFIRVAQQKQAIAALTKNQQACIPNIWIAEQHNGSDDGIHSRPSGTGKRDRAFLPRSYARAAEPTILLEICRRPLTSSCVHNSTSQRLRRPLGGRSLMESTEAVAIVLGAHAGSTHQGCYPFNQDLTVPKLEVRFRSCGRRPNPTRRVGLCWHSWPFVACHFSWPMPSNG